MIPALADSRTYVALDLETTGVVPGEDDIIEVAALRFRGGGVLESFSSLIRPSKAIPYHVQKLTGLSNEDVRAAPPMEAVVQRLLDFVGDDPAVGHNIAFDLAFLQRWGVGLANPVVDTWPLARVVLPAAASHSLTGLAGQLGLPQSVAHRALADAELASHLFLRLLAEGTRLHRTLLEAIVDMARRSQWALAPVFEDMLAVAVREGFQRQERPLSLDGLEEELAALTGPLAGDELHPRDAEEPLDAERLEALLSPGSPLAAMLGVYEHRPQQQAMLREVARAFNEGSHLMAEAGTGTGKSLAYLLPSLFYALQNGRRVVISSHTINLQEQLWKRDIPALVEALDLGVKTALLKGRGNYVCLRRLKGLRLHPALHPEAATLVARTLVWLSQLGTQGGVSTGDRAEMSVLAREELEWWGHISSDSQDCSQSSCNGHVPCFFFRARAKASQAHLVVVNHALLLSDAFVSSAVLPDYDHLIVDEAHRLEEVATDALSFRASESEVDEAVGRLVESLRHVQRHLALLALEEAEAESAAKLIKEAIERLTPVDAAARKLYQELRGLWADQQPAYQRGEDRLRLTPALRRGAAWTRVEMGLADAGAAYAAARQPLDRLLGTVEGSQQPLVLELRHAHTVLHRLWTGIGLTLVESRNFVAWLERRQPRRGSGQSRPGGAGQDVLSLHLAPVHVGELLRRGLFDRLETVVLTSATLQTQGSFAYLRERLGLEDFDEAAFGSPFDYPRAVLVYVPRDLPEPNQPGYQPAVASTLVQLFRATQGRGLALFTSWSQLNETYRLIAPALEEAGVQVMAQGLGGSRHQLLERFRHEEAAVLLGTASFWEGIDVPGEALSCLVIVRLPFDVPTDPVYAARSEQFDRPFEEFGVPRAILRFRQGFGRLIRRHTDRGMLVVLDSRLVSKSYGAAFRASLPPCQWQIGPARALPQAAGRWLERGAAHQQ